MLSTLLRACRTALLVVALHAPATAYAQTPGAEEPGSTGPPASPAPSAPADTAQAFSTSGFIDTYYAWDFNRPSNFDRAYTTQPARHAEFNVNLAYVDLKLSGPRYRGRLGLQWGTSVQANYAAEPKLGVVSGPNVSQFLQEATLGYRLKPGLWLDAGIFFAHVGYEGWVSRDNLACSRSLVADYSPYYEAGAKLTWTASPKVTATLAIVNGWQVISNYNTPPAGGVRVDYAPNAKLTLTYDNFVGNMAADTADARVRVYHDIIAQYNPSDRWQFAAVYSLGTQTNSTSAAGTATWWGVTTFAKYHATPKLAFVGRIESYSDPNQVIVATGLPNGLQTKGGSIGMDVKLAAPLLWRTELRGFRATDAVWPMHHAGQFGRNDGFLVSSLALTF
jgi:hypothetical protein